MPDPDDLLAPGLGVTNRPQMITPVDGVGTGGSIGVHRRVDLGDEAGRLPAPECTRHGTTEEPTSFVRQARVAVRDDAFVLAGGEPERQ